MNVAQLRVISSGTFLASPIRVADLVRAVKAAGYEAIALTDVNVVYNLAAFYDAAKAADIKPLLGMQLVIDDENLVLIAENQTGYQQLQRISTAVQFDHHTLAELPDFTGLAAITTEYGPAYQDFARGDGNAAVVDVKRIAAKNPGSLNIGLPGVTGDADLEQFATLHGWTPVVLGDVRELVTRDTQTRQVLEAIAQDKKVTQLAESSREYILPESELWYSVVAAAGLTESIAGTEALAERCQVELSKRNPELPQFSTPAGMSSSTYLEQLATTGLQGKIAAERLPEYEQRLHHELQVIDEMGFADYFLIVQDIIKAAKAKGIMTGPGRGSAAGSLVAYCLGITAVDPLKFGLLFERFLNQNRRQMPDIDIDVQDNRRAEVLEYIQERYGRDKTAQIAAFSTFGPRQAVRDVAKALGMASYAIDNLTPLIPSKVATIAEALNASDRLRDAANDDSLTKNILRIASRIVGLPKTVTTHAAGVVLSATPLETIVGLQKSGVGIGVQTQATKVSVERLGLLKIDVLGLRTLSLLTSMEQFVIRNFDTNFKLEAIPLDDEATLKLFAAGRTLGVFQFESTAMQRTLRKVSPLSFEDVVATAALYRPGPMQFIDEFTRRMHGTEAVRFATELLRPILAPTYGVIVYQEQVMQVAHTVGRMTLAQADDLRRAMSKKQQALIDAGQSTFVQGALQNELTEDAALQIYAAIERFAGYGFNRSHAVAYGVLAFKMAYIKQHFPAAFFATQLNANFGNRDKTQMFVNELKAAGVTLLPPDINYSGSGYRIWQGKIRVGLSAIRGLRRDTAAEIVAQQKNGHKSASMQVFLVNCSTNLRNASVLMPLVQAGAFDSVDADRANLIAGLPRMIEAVRLVGNDASLLPDVWPRKTAVQELSPSEKETLTAELIGYYVAGHPVDAFADLRFFLPLTDVGHFDQQGTMLVMAVDVRTITTKKGTKMAYMTVQDSSGSAEVTVFPKQYLQSDQLTSGQVYVLRARLDRDSAGDERRLIADGVEIAVNTVRRLPDALFLNLGPNPDATLQKAVLRILRESRGRTMVNLTSSGRSVWLDQRYAVRLDAELRAQIQKVLGENAIQVHKPNIG